MLFTDSRSALVRLSDCIKIGLGSCADSTEEILKLYEMHEFAFRRAREIALRVRNGEISDEELRDAGSGVPMEVATEGVQLQGRLHSQSLATVLNCCFVIESYANSFAHFLKEEGGAIEKEARTKLESSFGVGERTPTTEKWAILGSVGGRSFDRSRSPFQDLVLLFRFRDDLVHDKPVQWSVERSQARYGGRLADPVLGLLDLNHALFAAGVYWALVTELHSLSGVSADRFHRHYNLQPWLSDDHARSLRQLAKRYEKSGIRGK